MEHLFYKNKIGLGLYIAPLGLLIKTHLRRKMGLSLWGNFSDRENIEWKLFEHHLCLNIYFLLALFCSVLCIVEFMLRGNIAASNWKELSPYW